jgi:type IV secretion system protein VirB6/type IV secretion system protein TrbL
MQSSTSGGDTESNDSTNTDTKEELLYSRKRKRVGTMRRYALGAPVIVLLVVFVLSAPEVACAQTANVQGVVDTLLAKYKNAGQTWANTIQQAATNLFWLLATISLGWTCISMSIKQSDLVEIVAELCRYIMFTGLFYWLLLNGPTFAHDILVSLWQVGGNAAGTGQAIYPGKLINLGMQVYQQTLQHVNWLQPESIVAPIIIAIIILIVCALIAVNMMLLLCAAWIVLYAGLIFLGFGGCRWTSDMAINYYRTMLGIGVALMTMQLIIGIGVQFLQDLVASTSQTLDASQLGILLCAVIILAVISHRLPHMVAGMVVGGGHNGAIGGVGMMTLFAAGMTGMSLAGRLSGNPAAMLATEGVGEGAKMLQDRIAAAEAAMGSQNPQASTLSASSYESAGASSTSIGSNSSGFGTASPMSWYGRRSGSGSATSAASKTSVSAASSTTSGAEPDGGGKAAPAEPPQERPMSADEARGFGPDGNGGSGDQPYTPTSDDQVS